MNKFNELLKTISDKEMLIIKQIAERAVKDYAKHDIQIDPISTAMDLLAVHKGCVKLDLKKLLEFDEFNFAHDITGINNCLDREKIELKNCFLPRCAR